MRSSFIAIVVTGAGVAVASTTHADVLLHLKSGGTIRAARTWTEGDMVKVHLDSGDASFAASSIESIEEVPALPGADDAPADSGAAAPASKHVKATQPPAPPKADAQASAPPAKPAPKPLAVDKVPRVDGEDSQTKLERLDALSMKTHRELSIARRQGEPEETLKALEEKVDEINRQREDTMRKLGTAH